MLRHLAPASGSGMACGVRHGSRWKAWREKGATRHSGYLTHEYQSICRVESMQNRRM